jgi:uncharacterized membrane protein YgaE (UPF0421/DUF939 family)
LFNSSEYNIGYNFAEKVLNLADKKKIKDFAQKFEEKFKKEFKDKTSGIDMTKNKYSDETKNAQAQAKAEALKDTINSFKSNNTITFNNDIFTNLKKCYCPRQNFNCKPYCTEYLKICKDVQNKKLCNILNDIYKPDSKTYKDLYEKGLKIAKLLEYDDVQAAIFAYNFSKTYISANYIGDVVDRIINSAKIVSNNDVDVDVNVNNFVENLKQKFTASKSNNDSCKFDEALKELAQPSSNKSVYSMKSLGEALYKRMDDFAVSLGKGGKSFTFNPFKSTPKPAKVVQDSLSESAKKSS